MSLRDELTRYIRRSFIVPHHICLTEDSFEERMRKIVLPTLLITLYKRELTIEQISEIEDYWEKIGANDEGEPEPTNFYLKYKKIPTGTILKYKLEAFAIGVSDDLYEDYKETIMKALQPNHSI